MENYSKTNSLNNLIEITHIIGSTGVGGVQKNLLSKLKYDKEFNISRKIICINHKDGSLKEDCARAQSTDTPALGSSQALHHRK